MNKEILVGKSTKQSIVKMALNPALVSMLVLANFANTIDNKLPGQANNVVKKPTTITSATEIKN